MPKCNHRRGQDRIFVFRREHGRLTHHTYHKGKRDSLRYWKRWDARRVRRIPAHVKPRIRRSVRWLAY